MLELRPACEHCNKNLPPNAVDAMICSFECTYCKACVDGVLEQVCPNCGGGFSSRPVRPARNWNGENYLGKYPASTKIKHRPVDARVHQELVARLKAISPADR